MPPKRSVKGPAVPKHAAAPRPAAVTTNRANGSEHSSSSNEICLPGRPSFPVSYASYQNQLKGKEKNQSNKLLSCYDKNQYEEALQLCDKLLLDQPYNCDFCTMRGAILAHISVRDNDKIRTGIPGTDQYLTAENRDRVSHAWLDRSIELHHQTQADTHFSYHVYGIVSKEEKNYEKAYELYEKASKLSNYNPSMVHNFVNCAICLSKYKEAIHACEILIERDYRDDFIKTLQSLTLCYYIIGDYKNSLKYCDESIKELKNDENIRSRTASSNFAGAFTEFERSDYDYHVSHLYLMRNNIVEKIDGKKVAYADLMQISETEFAKNVNNVIDINRRAVDLTLGVSGEDNRRNFIRACKNLIDYIPEDVYTIDVICREILKSSKMLLQLPVRVTVTDIEILKKNAPNCEKYLKAIQDVASPTKRIVMGENLFIWGAYSLLMKAINNGLFADDEEAKKKIPGAIKQIQSLVQKVINSNEAAIEKSVEEGGISMNDYEKTIADWIKRPEIAGSSVGYEFRLIIALASLNEKFVSSGSKLNEEIEQDIKTLFESIIEPYIQKYGVKKEVLAFSESLRHCISLYSINEIASSIFEAIDNEIASKRDLKRSMFGIRWRLFAAISNSDRNNEPVIEELSELSDALIASATTESPDTKISLLPEYTMTKCEVLTASTNLELKKKGYDLAKTVPKMEVGDRYLSTFLYKIAYANDDHEGALAAYALFQPKFDPLLQSQEMQDFVFMTEALKSYLRMIAAGDMEYVFRAMKMCEEILSSGTDEEDIMNDFVNFYLKKLSTLTSFVPTLDSTLNRIIQTRPEVEFAAVVSVALSKFIANSPKFQDFYSNKEKLDSIKEKLTGDYGKHFEAQVAGDKADGLAPGLERIREYDHYCFNVVETIQKADQSLTVMKIIQKAFPRKMYKCMIKTLTLNSTPTLPYYIYNPYATISMKILDSVKVDFVDESLPFAQNGSLERMFYDAFVNFKCCKF